MSITTAQIRGARGILDWSQTDLAERTGISATSIGSIENGQTSPRANTLTTIQTTFENAGIEFIGKDGVRIKAGDVCTYTGQSGYIQFFTEVYQELEKNPGAVYVNNVDERKFAKWHGELGESHVDKMAALEGITYKILLQEGDTFQPAADYAEYRWLPKEQFASVPFYVFGRKLAMMLFDIEPTIILLNYPAVTQAYRKQFEAIWKSATPTNIRELKETAQKG